MAGGQAADPQPILELLPASERGSVSLRSVRDLKRRGDDLIRAVGIPWRQRPSQLIEVVLNWLEIRAACREDAPLSLILTSAGEKPSDFGAMLLAVPFTSREQMATELGIHPASEDVTPLPRHLGQDLIQQAALTSTRVLLAGSRDLDVSARAIQSVLNDPPLAGRLSPRTRSSLNDADILIHFGPVALLTDNGEIPAGIAEDWFPEEALTDPDERQVAAQLIAAIPQLQHSFISFQLEDGLIAQTRFVFDGAVDTPVHGLLRDLQPAATPALGSPSLAGLPSGPVFLAVTTRLTSERQQLLIRTLGQLYRRHADQQFTSFFHLGTSIGPVTDIRHTVALGALAEVIPLAREVRAAVYPHPEGAAAVIVILETEHPGQIIDSIRELVDFLEPAHPAPPVSDEQLQSLTRDLAADDFAPRNRAGTRLMLLGPQAEPWLERAAQSDDARVRERAAGLLAKMEASERLREQQFLADNPLASAHPQLTCRIAAEMRQGLPVDLIEISLPESESRQRSQLDDMLGPDWNRVRIAALPEHVVIALGREGPHLDETLQNLLHGRPGLAGDVRLVTLPEDPRRLLEFHFPFSRFVARNPHIQKRNLPAEVIHPSRALTAFSISADSTELESRLHLPVEELRGLILKRGWSW